MTIKALVSNGVGSAVEELAPVFERATGHKLAIDFGLGAVFKRRIESGEGFDLTILTAAAIDELAKQGRVDGASRAAIASSGVGIGIRAGEARADIGTREALERALSAAKSITWAKEGVGGVYFAALLERLGIAEAMKPKVVISLSGAEVGKRVASGEVQYGVILVNEILAAPGMELLAPLPPELQKMTAFHAAVAAGSKQAPAAKALIEFLRTPSARAVFVAKGQEPA
jgi:molybdate transport system substrate-binding protein